MESARGFDTFDLYCVHIMSLLVRNDAEPDTVTEVVEHLRELKLMHYSLIEKIRVIEEKANIDIKTGLYKYSEVYLENVLKIASRALDGKENENYHVSYIRFDIDDFSRLNNTYGHDLGDRVLQGLASIIRETIRPTDWPIRFGGEEFDVILPTTDMKGAIKVLGKIFQRVRAFSLVHEATEVRITVSAGVTEYAIPVSKIRDMDRKDSIKDYLRIQKEADDALYESKAKGKNQYNVYDPKRKRLYPGLRKQYAEKSRR